MSKNARWLPAVLFLMVDCSHLRPVCDSGQKAGCIERINHLGRQKKAEIYLMNGDQLESVRLVHIQSDTIIFFMDKSMTSTILSLDQVEKVQFTNHFSGAVEGLILGSLTGIFGGVALRSYILATDRGSAYEGFGRVIAAGVPCGALLGLLTGGGSGSKEVFRFHEN